MHKVSIDYNGYKISLETGRLAKQADGAVLVTYGETMVLVTAVANKSNENSLGYFPLTCTYQFRGYAAGKIPGGFFKRESKPSDSEVLISRMIDRPIRPLFPKEFQAETQIIASVLSYDPKCTPEIAAILGASAALGISDIPFTKPIAAAVVGYQDDKFILNPTQEELKTSKLNLLVVASKNEILMVESEADQLPEQKMLEALEFAQSSIASLIDLQQELIKIAAKPKRTLTPVSLDSSLADEVQKTVASELKAALTITQKQDRYKKISQIKEQLIEKLADKYLENSSLVDDLFDSIKAETMRLMILNDNKRVDGRTPTQIRDISCETGILPHAHGSSLFTRGETQALVSTTLGSKDDEKLIDDPAANYYKKFYLHYNFPPFSVGETGRMGPPSRREVGHGRLAERALAVVLPSTTTYPYTIRVVSEILESNGSSSMATICGGTLALQAAGVPITSPVAGIAMGLIYTTEKSVILSDILGDEDHVGDLDFKVAGTKQGITALQMDVKIDGLSMELLKESLEQAKEGRLHILQEMEKTVKNEVSKTASKPHFVQLKIPVNKIREVIGAGGQVIKGITAESGAKIDINDNGLINIHAPSKDNADLALSLIQQKIGMLQIGQIYNGIIKGKIKLGFFVQCVPNVDGLLPMNQIQNPDKYKEGDSLNVMVSGYDKFNRLQLSLVKE